MNTCKLCGMIAEHSVAKNLPNLLVETERAVVVVNRRPISAGHVTVILKRHLAHTGALDDDAFGGVGVLFGRLSAVLEARHRPHRVILLGDGKQTPHLHFHLIPEPTPGAVSLADAIADLNQPVREPTLSLESIAACAAEMAASFHAPPVEARQ